VDRLTHQLLSGTRTPMGMPMDVWQGDDGYHVALDLPGVDPSTVEITSERNVLTSAPNAARTSSRDRTCLSRSGRRRVHPAAAAG